MRIPSVPRLRPRAGSLRRLAARPGLHAFTGLAALAVAALLVPVDGNGCAGPLLSQAQAATAVPTFTRPAADEAAWEADRRAITEAKAVVVEKQAAVDAADDLQDEADELRDRARDAESEVLGGGGSSWEVTSAESAVRSAESRLRSAESWVTTVEDMNSGGSGSYYSDMVVDAKDDVEAARAELDEKKRELASVKAEQAAADQARRTAEATAESLAAEADAKEAAADEAMDAAFGDLTRAKADLAAAERRHSQREGAQEEALIVAYQEHRLTVREIEAANAVLADCRSNALPQLAAAGVLLVTAFGIALHPLTPWARRRRRSEA